MDRASVGNGRRGIFPMLLLPVVAVLSGCVEERLIQADRFPPLPDGAGSFVGYSNETTKLTVCGNCHVESQSEWVETAHADAWATLEANPGAQAFCEGCHTVGQLGSSVATAGGWETTGDTRYHDVQCESCHGTGLAHVENPELSQPHAPLSVETTNDAGCGECHSGTHHPFVEEWEQSGHGTVVSAPADRAECQSCHTGENALLAWGVNADYIEKQQVLNAPGAHLPITCGVCHDPHAADNDKQLRFPIDVPSEEHNLCMKCHHKRGVPDPTTFRGPHAPEGPVLLGYGGWWPPSLEFAEGSIVASHGSERNPRLCAGCHVNSFTVTDAQTGGFTFQSTGHLFQAIPCLDAQRIPTTGDCAVAERTFQTCAAPGGCHSAAGAQSAYVTVGLRVEQLAAELEALLGQVPASEFSTTDNRYTTGEGSQFNLELARTRGSPIHNPFLIEALLIGSIRQVRSDYGLAAQSPVSLERQLGR